MSDDEDDECDEECDEDCEEEEDDDEVDWSSRVSGSCAGDSGEIANKDTANNFHPGITFAEIHIPL